MASTSLCGLARLGRLSERNGLVLELKDKRGSEVSFLARSLLPRRFLQGACTCTRRSVIALRQFSRVRN